MDRQGDGCSTSRPESAPSAALEDALQAARASEILLAEAQHIARMGSWSWDVGSDTVQWSDELHRLFGRQSGSGPASFEEYIAAVHPEDRARVKAGVENLVATARPHEHDYRILLPTGEERWMHARIEVTDTRDGRPARLGGYCQDITDQRLAEMRTHAAQSELVSYQRALEHVARGKPVESALELICRDIERQCPGARCSVLLADHATNTLRHMAAPSLPPSFARAIDGLPVASGNGACGTAAALGDTVVVEDTLRDELTRPFVDLASEHDLRSVWSQPLRSSGGELLGTFAMYRTICHRPDQREIDLVTKAGYLAALALEHHVAQERLARAMQIDPLTELPNRAWFLTLVESRLAQVTSQMAVMFLDIDGFKWINDSHGHALGDSVLVEVAGRLTEHVGPNHVLARIGGDDFTVLIEHATPESIEVVAAAVQNAFAVPYRVEGGEFFLSVSAGTAVATPSSTALDMIRDADTAMYAAKKAGRFSHIVFDSSLHSRAVSRITLETELRRAIDRQEFLVHLQPVRDLQTGSWVSAEALARWDHPQRGLVRPDEFIPFAEETGMISALGQRILEQTLPLVGPLYRDGAGIKVAVNLSVIELTDPSLPERLAEMLEMHRVPTGALILEVTESAVMEHVAVAHRVLQSLAESGIDIVIDDFGTGYSSIARLGELPVVGIKADGSFSKRLGQDDGAARVLGAIVDLAHAVNLHIVAEGIETPEALAVVQDMGCDRGQGYHLARPMPVEDLHGILAD